MTLAKMKKGASAERPPSQQHPRPHPTDTNAKESIGGFDMVPYELKQRPQWVCWRYEADSERPDKLLKVPYNAKTGKRADTTNPEDWSSYSTAQAAVEVFGMSGVGFVFNHDDPYVGIDLDDCRDPETGAIAPWALRIMQDLKSYSEISPSQCGIKIFTIGEKPKKGIKRAGRQVPEGLKPGDTPGGIEIYGQARYFTVTGQHLPSTPVSIEHANGNLTALIEALRRPEPNLQCPPPPQTPAPAGDHARRWAEERLQAAEKMLTDAPEGMRHNTRLAAGKLAGGVVAHGFFSAEEATARLFQARPPEAHAATEIKAIRDGIAAGIAEPLPLPTFPTSMPIIVRDGHGCCPACDTPVKRSQHNYPGSSTPGWYCPKCKNPMVWPLEAHPPQADADDLQPKEKRSHAQILIDIGRECELFLTPLGEPCARVRVNGHHETMSMGKGGAFRRWLTHRFYLQAGSPPSSNAVGQAMEVLDAFAHIEGETRQTYTRIAHHNGKVYLDLADEQWQAVEIDSDGWRIIAEPPVLFVRSRGVLPLPVPERGTNGLQHLRPFLNVKTEEDWIIVQAWLVGTLSEGPYPHLALFGEQGCAKSSATRFLRAIFDPNEADARNAPRKIDDLHIAAKNAHVVAFDNLSYIPDWFSDALCRLSTGAADSTRALYTNDGEFLFKAKRPAIFNGIADLATRGDLVDRLLNVTLTPITEDARKEERVIWEQFHAAQPVILGGLCSAVSMALQRRDSISLPNLQRMADFQRWVEAAAPALGWQDGQFSKIYIDMRNEASTTVLESSLLATLMMDIFVGSTFSGTARELLERLHATFEDEDGKRKIPRSFPKDPARLSGELRKLAPELRRHGVDLDLPTKPEKVNGRTMRMIGVNMGSVQKVLHSSVTSVTSVTAEKTPHYKATYSGYAGDASGDAGDAGGDAGDAGGDAGDAGGDAGYAVGFLASPQNTALQSPPPPTGNAGNAGNADLQQKSFSPSTRADQPTKLDHLPDEPTIEEIEQATRAALVDWLDDRGLWTGQTLTNEELCAQVLKAVTANFRLTVERRE